MITTLNVSNTNIERLPENMPNSLQKLYCDFDKIVNMERLIYNYPKKLIVYNSEFKNKKKFNRRRHNYFKMIENKEFLREIFM